MWNQLHLEDFPLWTSSPAKNGKSIHNVFVATEISRYDCVHTPEGCFREGGGALLTVRKRTRGCFSA